MRRGFLFFVAGIVCLGIMAHQGRGQELINFETWWESVDVVQPSNYDQQQGDMVDSSYVIQVAAYYTDEHAESYASQLFNLIKRDQQFSWLNVYLFKVQTASGVLSRVAIGHFATAKQAQEYLYSLVSKNWYVREQHLSKGSIQTVAVTKKGS